MATYLTPTQVADLLMVSPVTIRQWAQKGMIKASVTPGGHRRFMYHDVVRFARDKGLTLNTSHNDKPKILIVDDDMQLVSYLVELFEIKVPQADVDYAYNGFEAGQKVQVFNPDIILLDLMMPGLNGFTVCKQLKDNPETKGIRIIAMTGYPSDENIKQITEAGAEQCLKKPVEVDVLLSVLGIPDDTVSEQQAV